MTYTFSYYDHLKSTHKRMNSMKDIEHIVTASTQEVDELSFMETFNFPPLGEIQSSLITSHVPQSEVDEVIAGLKTLPEYNRD